jgi:hypothetical protein
LHLPRCLLLWPVCLLCSSALSCTSRRGASQHPSSLPSDALREQRTGAAAVNALREENNALRAALAALALESLPEEALDMVGVATQPGSGSSSAAAVDRPSTSTVGAGPRGGFPPPSTSPQEGRSGKLAISGVLDAKRNSHSSIAAVDNAYFSSYSRLSIHREMLCDKVCSALVFEGCASTCRALYACACRHWQEVVSNSGSLIYFAGVRLDVEAMPWLMAVALPP